MSIPECPSFHEWYEAINGREPFPWQARLAEQVAETGEWPELVGIPTGLGKTACVDIAIWTLARQADRSPGDRTAPTRIWWVVNRRLLVDDTYQHASRVAALLADSDDRPSVVTNEELFSVDPVTGEAAMAVKAVAARLRSIAGVGPPLQALRLRGGDSRTRPSTPVQPHNRPGTPAQPAIICSTIPMYGSRVLFRGYGSSRSMRPIDAALAGTDSLLLLDEAHLAQPLQVLLESISGHGGLGAGDEQVLPSQRRGVAVASLTATGSPRADTFALNEDDRSNEEIQRRLGASKLLSIQQHAGGDPAKLIASAAKELLDSLDPEPAAGVLVFANTPKTALAIAKALDSRRDCVVRVATGRIRGAEASEVVDEITGRMRAGQSPGHQGNKHLVVVATQTLEVGADLDADYLITEACGVRALTQRLGRLNRLGQRSHARGVYVHVVPKDGQWPVYGDEPARVLEQLLDSIGFDEAVDMSPGKIANVLGDTPEESTDAPVLAEALLGEWVKTTTPPPGEAPVEPYFSGRLEQDRNVDVVWRVHVPDIGNRIWPRIFSQEVVSVPLHEARKALAGADCVRIGTEHSAEQIEKDGNGELVLYPGNTIIAPSWIGKLDSHGHWNPWTKELAQDASMFDNGLVISESTLAGLYEPVPEEPREAMKELCRLVKHEDGEPEPGDVEQAAVRLCNGLMDSDVPPPFDRDGLREQWSDFLQALRDGIDRGDSGQPVVEPASEPPRLPVYAHHGEPETAPQVSFDEYDELSIADPVSLEAHGNDTAAVAKTIAAAAGVDSRTAKIVELAARLHDIGKADIRFQNWLDPDNTHPGLLAKSNTPGSEWERLRNASGWPRGGRHEELSRRLAYAWLAQGDHGLTDEDQKLLLHLVVAHHGRGRPLVAPVNDQNGTTVDYQIEGREVTAGADLSCADWEQPARFAALNRRYGCWGLALLEAIVRQADHLMSQKGEIR
ncbi:type I-G CRISPR-associated helicase/endonuclease Cas3g [Candidatus Poriferisocius sp.]|uniref:type I-G CRISPR-associated helicase/endonuclease Cas3g n=1 Tax=Candidatus Poriferisocius sp. TaxID=3101276 RepID=UPI003B5C450F